MRTTCLLIAFFCSSYLHGQTTIKGRCTDADGNSMVCKIYSLPSGLSTSTDSNGYYNFSLLQVDDTAICAINEFKDSLIKPFPAQRNHLLVINFRFSNNNMDEVVISGTMTAVQKNKSPIAVETFKSQFLRKNISPTLFESIGMINGIRPQINCNVCNTGDIHMNGLEGPYTLVLIDGMPVMSSLASVYGIVGIPGNMVEKIEVVRGPASTIYGSESMGGLINIITKSASNSPLLSFETSINSWGENNMDLGIRLGNKKTRSMLGINTFYYQGLQDNNKDGFTDLANQKRISLFNKIDFNGKYKSSLMLRYTYENRWGGQTQWNPNFRGGDSIYGESVFTHHLECIGYKELDNTLKIQYSWVYHNQNSAYGNTLFLAKQSTAFAQITKTKKIKNINLLAGAAMKHNYYDDNTPATAFNPDNIQNLHTYLPGVFLQMESNEDQKFQYLAGYRLDFHNVHGFVQSPRLAIKYNVNPNHYFRLQTGTGFRVVNLFTEEHAAISGDRNIIISEKLNPEKSYSGSIQYTTKYNRKHLFIGQDITAYYTYFSNKIIGDFITDPNAIIFSNINGMSISRGISYNSNWSFSVPFTANLGVTYAAVFSEINHVIQPLFHAPKWSGNFNLGYTFIPIKTTLNISGMVNGPMRLPVLPNDFRPEYSPTFCLLNAQISTKIKQHIECYFGIKNLLNFLPQNPLMRPEDPFDKQAADPIKNPMGYTFDTSYNYAPLQGRRFFLGIKIQMF